MNFGSWTSILSSVLYIPFIWRWTSELKEKLIYNYVPLLKHTRYDLPGLNYEIFPSSDRLFVGSMGVDLHFRYIARACLVEFVGTRYRI